MQETENKIITCIHCNLKSFAYLFHKIWSDDRGICKRCNIIKSFNNKITVQDKINKFKKKQHCKQDGLQ